MVCTPSHTIPYQERHTIGEGLFAQMREPASFHFVPRRLQCYDHGFGGIAFWVDPAAERSQIKRH